MEYLKKINWINTIRTFWFCSFLWFYFSKCSS